MNRSRRRGNRDSVQRFRVHLTINEARELRALIRDDDGEADEDVLDDVYETLRGGKRDAPRDVTLLVTKKQRESVFRVLDDEHREGDDVLLKEVLTELDLGIAKHSRKTH